MPGGITRHTVLVTLVACAVGATASAAVIFSLASSPATQPGVPSISPQAVVRNVGASEVPKTVQDGHAVEPTPSPRAITSDPPKTTQDRPDEPMPRPAVTSTASGLDDPVNRTEAEHQTEAPSQQSRKHGRVVRRWHEHYWRRFAHNSSPRPFGFW